MQGVFLFVADQVLDRFGCAKAFCLLCLNEGNQVSIFQLAKVQRVGFISLIVVPLFHLCAGMRFPLRLFLILY